MTLRPLIALFLVVVALCCLWLPAMISLILLAPLSHGATALILFAGLGALIGLAVMTAFPSKPPSS